MAALASRAQLATRRILQPRTGGVKSARDLLVSPPSVREPSTTPSRGACWPCPRAKPARDADRQQISLRSRCVGAHVVSVPSSASVPRHSARTCRVDGRNPARPPRFDTWGQWVDEQIGPTLQPPIDLSRPTTLPRQTPLSTRPAETMPVRSPTACIPASWCRDRWQGRRRTVYSIVQ